MLLLEQLTQIFYVVFSQFTHSQTTTNSQIPPSINPTQINPRATKRLRKSQLQEDNEYFHAISARMIEQSESTTRLQERMVELLTVFLGDLSSQNRTFHNQLATLCHNMHPQIWPMYAAAANQNVVDFL